MDKAVGYVRVSRVGGRDGDSFLSPDHQRESIERVCAREGLELVDVLEELDRSGGDSARPLWNAALERVERGEVQALVVWNFSRFSRSAADAELALRRIESVGGRLLSLGDQAQRRSRVRSAIDGGGPSMRGARDQV